MLELAKVFGFFCFIFLKKKTACLSPAGTWETVNTEQLTAVRAIGVFLYICVHI